MRAGSSSRPPPPPLNLGHELGAEASGDLQEPRRGGGLRSEAREGRALGGALGGALRLLGLRGLCEEVGHEVGTLGHEGPDERG